jgi:hypothetical protein
MVSTRTRTTFTFLTELKGLAAGVVGNTPIASSLGIAAATFAVQLGTFGIIDTLIGGGPVSGPFLGQR